MNSTNQLQKNICCFAGHRPQNLPFELNENDSRCIALKEKLKETIIYYIEKEQVTHFISGMEQGVDTYAAEIILSLKKKYPELFLEAAIPYLSLESKWNKEQKKRYYEILRRCDKITLLNALRTPDCMQKRNKYMIEKANHIIAVWNGQPGGTEKMIQYAKATDRTIKVLHPITLKIQ